jgi:glyoxylase-like metal-dependent hydrolase (beta-lactamase superfamily II)/rhodanese-related sulfurtransferase
MYFEQFYLACLAHASYMIGSQGEAAIVDPQRDIDIYLKAAEEQGLSIRYVFETHLHADFVSGHRELASRTGAKICIGAKSGAKFPHVDLSDGSELQVGRVRLRTLETPGHTPESICIVVTDEEKSPSPYAVLTGDTLFIGDVGRPDLSATHTPAELAGLLYDSLHQKLMALPDNVMVYPAHGAGSLCGRNMRAERSSTIGTERLTNYALQIRSRDEFIRQMTSNLPARPDYFLQDAEINRAGAPALTDLPQLPAILPAELQDLLHNGATVLDVRAADEFAVSHVPGSINIPLSGQFASWAGTILGLHSDPVLIAGSPQQLVEARTRLARVGMEDLRGYLQDGVQGWHAAGLPLESIPQISVQELHDRLQRRQAQEGHLAILDVRREGEWNAGHIGSADWHPLDNFRHELPRLNGNRTTAVHCKSGYRSAIACSLLKRAGILNVINVQGGFDAWQQAGLPEVQADKVSA